MSDEEVIEVTVDIAELKKLKVAELKRKLAELGLDNKGTKAELIARVEKYLTEQEEVDEDLLEEEEGEEEEGEGEGSEEVIDELVSGEDKMAAATDAAASSAASGGGKEGEGEGDGEKTEQKQLKDTTTPTPANSGGVPAAKDSGVVGGAAPPTSTGGQETITTAAAGAAETKVSMSGLSGAERLARRAARFGENTSIDAKKLARAERFGTTLENGAYKGLGKRPLSDEDMERLRKRGERFGSSVSPSIAKVEDEERKKKRIEKFGLGTTDLSEEDRKKKRAEKFGT